MISKNGDSYQGQWKNDKEHGHGVYLYNHHRIEGIWDNGALILHHGDENSTRIEDDLTVIKSQAEDSEYMQIAE